MKKIIVVLSVFLTLTLIFFSFGYKKNTTIKTYYNVYLKEELLGTIDSKSDLDKYINEKNKLIRNKYKIDTVYTSKDLNIEKINSYSEKTMSTSSMYNTISSKSSFTIKGYTIKIKSSSKDKKTKTLYVLDKSVFNDAVIEFIKIYVGEERYNNYINNTQPEIEDTGSIIENIYIDEDITIKETNISVDENIYTDSKELAQFLVFGNNVTHNEYEVETGDTIIDIAFKNQVSIEELIISNPKITSKNSLLYVGQVININQTNPQVSVVVETYTVEDTVSKFTVEERLDSTQYKGYTEVIQEGTDGVDRVTQKVKSINNYVTFVQPISIKEITASINKVVIKGDKTAPHIGDLTNWLWPTQNGWVITDEYGYRIHPISGERSFHSGIDISGTGYGSKIYAVNNGTIVKKEYYGGYGYSIIINHNNGYWTLYAHMSKFANVNLGDTVVAGQVIGYMGSSGDSTGPHLHFEVSKGSLSTRINPWSIYD